MFVYRYILAMRERISFNVILNSAFQLNLFGTVPASREYRTLFGITFITKTIYFVAPFPVNEASLFMAWFFI